MQESHAVKPDVTEFVADDIQLSGIDTIIPKHNMDTKNKVEQFEKFMMTDPEAKNEEWWKSLKKAKFNLTGHSFKDTKIYPESVRKLSVET